MNRRDFFRYGSLTLCALLGTNANANENPKDLESLTEGLRRLSSSVSSIFQPEATNSIYLLRRNGQLEKLEEKVPGLMLKIYGIDGSIIPPVKRYFNKNRLATNQVGYALEYGNSSLILDCGAKLALDDEEMLKKAKAIMLSHIHPDHIIHFWQIQKKAGYPMAYSPNILPSATITKEIPKMIDQFEIKYTKTMHSIKTYAYKFKVDNKVICYTGDANYTNKLAEFCKGSDLLLSELTYDDKKLNFIDSHMGPKEVIRLAKKAKPRLLVLTHFKHLSPEDSERIVKKEFPSTISARPGFSFIIE